MEQETSTRRLEELSQLLDREQDRVTLALDACGAGIWDWDIANDRLHWGVGMHKLFGITHFGGRYADFERCLLPSDVLIVRAAVQRAIETHAVYDCKFRLTSRPGVLLRGRGKCYYKDGVPVRFIGVNVEEAAPMPAFCPIAQPGCPVHFAVVHPSGGSNCAKLTEEQQVSA